MATFSGDVQYSQDGTVTNPCITIAQRKGWFYNQDNKLFVGPLVPLKQVRHVSPSRPKRHLIELLTGKLIKMMLMMDSNLYLPHRMAILGEYTKFSDSRMVRNGWG
jgi:hypothetical protein